MIGCLCSVWGAGWLRDRVVKGSRQEPTDKQEEQVPCSSTSVLHTSHIHTHPLNQNYLLRPNQRPEQKH